jgi:phage shock protein A
MPESEVTQTTSNSDPAAKLLDQVARRMKLAAFARTTFYTFIISTLLFTGAFLCSRLLGLFPFEFQPLMILSVPLLAFFMAMLFHRRPSLQQAARTVDTREETKDLYLTLSLLSSSAGEYQPLVKQAAQEKAKLVKPKKVVPYSWDRRGWVSLSTIGLLVVLVLFVPQLDPFGKIQEAVAVEERRGELDELAKLTIDRKKRLEKKQSSQDLKGESVSEDVKRAIDALVDTLEKMKDLERKENEAALTKQQKKLGAKWNQVRNGADLRALLKQNHAQAFGRNMQQLRDWADQLRKGQPIDLQKKIDELTEKLLKLRKIKKEDKDDVETLKKKEELKRQIKKEIEQLQEFAKRHAKTSKMRDAIERAMQQLEAGEGEKKLSDQAIEDALESLKLSKLEIEELARSARDLETLQKALEAIQQAKRLNQQLEGEKLDGDWGDEPTLEQLREKYAEMLANLGIADQGDGSGDGEGNDGGPNNGALNGDGDGKGLGGPGQGQGGVAPENKNLKTNFVSKKAKAHVQAGKMIFSMKSRGVSEAGDVNVEFHKLIKEVKEGYSEAIEQEEIPPGYVPGIKKYFDRIEAAAAAQAGKENAE